MKTLIIALIAILCLFGMASLHATTYHYDKAGRLVKVIYDNGMETRYAYDDNGNLVARTTDVINSVAEAEPSTITVSPQPSHSWVAITLEGWEGAQVDVTIQALHGSVVQRVSRYVVNGELRLDVRTIPNGTYAVQLVRGAQRLTSTIVVVH